MEQLDQGLKISLSGATAEVELGRFRAQLDQWELAMPDVPPLVLDFGLGDFPHTGLIEYWIANEVDAGYCGKFLFVFDGQACPRHRHHTKMETFYVVKGRAEIEVGEAQRILAAGDVLPMPPMSWHGFIGRGPALLLETSTPCMIDDNEFADPRIPIGRGRASDGASSDESGPEHPEREIAGHGNELTRQRRFLLGQWTFA